MIEESTKHPQEQLHLKQKSNTYPTSQLSKIFLCTWKAEATSTATIKDLENIDDMD